MLIFISLSYVINYSKIHHRDKGEKKIVRFSRVGEFPSQAESTQLPEKKQTDKRTRMKTQHDKPHKHPFGPLVWHLVNV